MKPARKNRSSEAKGLTVDSNVSLTAPQLQEGQKKFSDWHWGIGANKVIDWGDKDYPPMLIECGRLVRMHVRVPEGKDATGNPHPRRRRDTMIELSRTTSENSHLAYDPDHPDERLYLLVDPQASQTLAKRFWTENDAQPMNLNRLAAIAGGRHGKRQDYPNLQVKPVGILTALVYFTEKQGDGRSFYIHTMAELNGGIHPVLSTDSKGRLWLAGGGYRVPTPGITD